MRIIARKHLVLFWSKHPDAYVSLARWEATMKRGSWQSLAEIQSSFSKAKALGRDRIRFEIGGGSYRLVVAFDFDRQAAFIKFIGTHAEYDTVDALNIAQF